MNIQQEYSVLTATGTVLEINTLGLDTLAVQVYGSMSGTLVIEATVDGKNWVGLNLVPYTSGTPATTITAAGVYFANVSGFVAARVRCSVYSSGTPKVSATATNGTSVLPAGVGSGGNSNGIISASSANTPAIATTDPGLAANASRKGWMIQNVGTNPLFVRLGASASSSAYHMVLKGGSGDNDGLGASFSQMDGVVYTGIVSIAGTSPKYVVLEL